jgi:putative endonuclease
MYHVYILYSNKIDRFYTGYTNNLERRFAEHNRKKGKYTDMGIPWQIVYTEQFENIEDAKNREADIKAHKSRLYIEELLKKAQ